MNTIFRPALFVSAVDIAALPLSASAGWSGPWSWNDAGDSGNDRNNYNNGYSNGNGHGYGTHAAPNGYAPFGQGEQGMPYGAAPVYR